MKLWMKLLLTMWVVAVLPLLFLSRYATSYFHHFTKQRQEAQMVQTARLVGEAFRRVEDADARRDLLAAYAEQSERRLRFFDANGGLSLDAGEVGEVDFADGPDVAEAMRTGEYAARWWLNPDRTRLYYFSSVPVFDEEGGLLGVAQVVEHTGGITRALLRLHRHQRTGIWWVFGVTVLFGAAFSLLLTRRLRRLRIAARSFAATGDLRGFDLPGRDEVSDLARGFRDMAAELKNRQAYNREFVLTTLHELKTPLTAMHGAADILETREALEPGDRKRFAGNIRYQSDRLLQLVRELQTLTSLDLDLPEENFEERPFGPMVNGILDRVRPGLNHPVEGIGLDLDVRVRVIPRRVEQALVNLLRNTDRYQRAGEPVRVVLTEQESACVLAVEDNGPGIDDENLGRVFDRFFTTVPRDAAGETGRGLGLAVVKRIVEHHGGEVFARNRPEGGAEVGFRLKASQKVSSVSIRENRL